MSSDNILYPQGMTWGVSLTPQETVEAPVQPATTEVEVSSALASVTPEQQTILEDDQSHAETWLQRVKTVGVNTVKTAVVVAEVTPINEMIRSGIFAALLTQTRDPAIAAAVFGGTTFVLEAGAALAVADWVAEDRIGRVIDRVDQSMARYPKIQKALTPKREVKVSGLAEVGTALLGGTVITMEAKQRENPSRTVEEVRRHGLFTATWMAGALAVSGALTAEGVTNIDSPWVWGTGAGLLGLAGLKAVFTKLKRNYSKGKEEKS